MFESGNRSVPGRDRLPAGCRHGLALALVFGVGLTLGACSTMADLGEATTDGMSKVANTLNPFNWFGDSDKEAATAPKTAIKPASPESPAQTTARRDENRYPNLSSVPDRPREAVSKRAEYSRRELRKGLVADSQNARYTDNALRAQTGGASAQEADSARSNERIAGEPPAAAAPTIPVMAGPVEPAPQTEAASQVPAPRATAMAPAPRTVPPSIRSVPPRDGSYGARQAAAASAAPAAQLGARAPLPASSARPAAPAPRGQVALANPAAEPAAPPRTVLKTVQVATIYFRSGSSRLSANDRRIVAQVAGAARRTGGMLRIIGHSSMANAGSDAERAAFVNYKVSLDRANAVASELLRQGIPGSQLQVMAEGAGNPIYAESAVTGTAGNRRTEVYLDFYERR